MFRTDSFRRLSLALVSLLAVSLTSCHQRGPSDIAKIEDWILVYETNLGDYPTARAAAEKMVDEGIRSGIPDTEARGLIRLSFLELASGKWRNEWDKKLLRAEELVEGSGTLADTELHMYRGVMRGVWLDRMDEGLEDLSYAITVASNLRADYQLALAHRNAAQLRIMRDDASLARMHANMAFEIALETEAVDLITSSVKRLVQVNFASNLPYENSLEFVQRAVEAGAIEEQLADLPVREISSESMEKIVLEVEGTTSPTPYELRNASSKCTILASRYAREGRYPEALRWSQTGLKFCKTLQDESSCQSFRIYIAYVKVLGGEREIDHSVLPSSDDKVPLQGSLMLMRMYAILGDIQRSEFWQSRVQDILTSRTVSNNRELVYSVRKARDSELATRESVDVMLADQEWANTLSLLLLGGFGLCVTIPLFWRYREKTRILRSLETEIHRREVEEHRNAELQEQLLASQRLEVAGTLAAGVAHDVNNALSVILGCATMAESEQSNTTRIGYLQTVMDATRLAANTTKGLLTFAKADSFEFSQVELVRVVKDAFELLTRVSSAAIKMELSLGIDHPIYCRGNTQKLKQVIMNLVLNARDAVAQQEAGRICLSLELDQGSAAIIHVRDNGAGIAPEHRDRLFEPFFSTKERGAGTGLGLAIVHGIVEEHGGKITFDSDPGEGTDMRVWLPTMEHNEEELPAEELECDGQGRALLVAEDEPKVMEVLRRQLTDMNFSVVSCTDGEQVLEQYSANRNRISGLVLDVDLPKHDGVWCLERIRNSFDASIPAVLISGRAVYPTDSRTQFLAKPVANTELKCALATLLPAEGEPRN